MVPMFTSRFECGLRVNSLASSLLTSTEIDDLVQSCDAIAPTEKEYKTAFLKRPSADVGPKKRPAAAADRAGKAQRLAHDYEADPEDERTLNMFMKYDPKVNLKINLKVRVFRACVNNVKGIPCGMRA